MDKQDYILKLVKKMTKLADKIYKYQSMPRDYGTGDKLYMREPHFIDMVGVSGMDMGELAQKLDVSNGAVSQLAARLEKKGYVYRQAKTEDSRCICCYLTEKGENMFYLHRKIDQEKYPFFFEALGDFSEQDLNQCNLFVEK